MRTRNAWEIERASCLGHGHPQMGRACHCCRPASGRAAGALLSLLVACGEGRPQQDAAAGAAGTGSAGEMASMTSGNGSPAPTAGARATAGSSAAGSSAAGTSAAGSSAGGPPAAGGAGDGGAGGQSAPEPARCDDAADKHERAERALADFLLRFWRADLQYLVEEIPGDMPAHYWVYAQAVDAVLDAAERTNGERFVGLAEALLLGQGRRTWSSDWYDDENWLALALIRTHDLTAGAEYLERAESLMRHIMDAWDETCCGPAPGGIWWDAAHTQKATASNGGPVITAARLAQRTGDDSYLAFAERAYAYWRQTMVDPDSYQVFDHVDPSGDITAWSFTYNEGVMIGAALALHEATGEASYLEDARGYAARMLAEQTTDGPAGAVLYDGTNTGCGGDCQQFKSIGYRYLDLLERSDPDAEIRALLQSSASSLWTVARDPQTGNFATNWAEPAASDGVTIRQMSAAVTALSLDATYCRGYSGEGRPIEAEEGLIRGVALENSHPGFTGFGYLAAWGSEDQGVDLRLAVRDAGSYALSFRYAAESDATRSLAVNGTPVGAALAFAATGSWQSYATIALDVELAAGDNILSIDYASSSEGYLNLDHVVVTP